MRHCFRGRALGSAISTFSSPPHHAWLSTHLTLMMSRKHSHFHLQEETTGIVHHQLLFMEPVPF